MDDQVPNVRSDWAWVVAAPLGWPVVPEVKMRSETSSGCTAAGPCRGRRRRSTCSPAARKLVQAEDRGTAAGPPRRRPSPSSRSTTMRPSAPVSSPASMAG